MSKKKGSQHWTQGCNEWSCVGPKMEAHSEITIIPSGCAGKQGNISRIGIRPNTYKAHGNSKSNWNGNMDKAQAEWQ